MEKRAAPGAKAPSAAKHQEHAPRAAGRSPARVRKGVPSGWTKLDISAAPAPHANAELRSKIEDAFRNAGVQSDRLHEAAFDILVHWGGPKVPKIPANVRDAALQASLRHSQPASRAATEKELDKLADAADTLLTAIQSLRWPALAAIGYNPFMARLPPGFVWGRYPDPEGDETDPNRPYVEGLHYDPSVLPWPNQQGTDFFTRGDLWVLQAQIGLLLASIEQKRIPENLPEKTGGAPVYAGRMRVGLLAARWFNQLSCENFIDHIHENNSLTKQRVFGRFVSLLASIFNALAIDANAGQTALDVRDEWLSRQTRVVEGHQTGRDFEDQKMRKKRKGPAERPAED